MMPVRIAKLGIDALRCRTGAQVNDDGCEQVCRRIFFVNRDQRENDRFFADARLGRKAEQLEVDVRNGWLIARLQDLRGKSREAEIRRIQTLEEYERMMLRLLNHNKSMLGFEAGHSFGEVQGCRRRVFQPA